VILLSRFSASIWIPHLDISCIFLGFFTEANALPKAPSVVRTVDIGMVKGGNFVF
jgi:hypothetical protein